MALTIDALKGLFKKLGGEDFGDVNTIPEAIDKVTEVASSGGGGSDEFVIIADLDVSTMSLSNISVDSVDEIKAAADAGKNVRLFASDETADVVFDAYAGLCTDLIALFSGTINPDGDESVDAHVVITDGDDGVVGEIDIKRFLPTVDSDDNGKTLAVDGGEWTLVNPNELYMPLVIHGTMHHDDDTNTDTVTITEELSDIYAAADAGRSVYLEAEFVFMTRLPLLNRTRNGEEYVLSFSCSYVTGGTVGVSSVEFNNSKTGTITNV